MKVTKGKQFLTMGRNSSVDMVISLRTHDVRGSRSFSAANGPDSAVRPESVGTWISLHGVNAAGA